MTGHAFRGLVLSVVLSLVNIGAAGEPGSCCNQPYCGRPPIHVRVCMDSCCCGNGCRQCGKHGHQAPFIPQYTPAAAPAYFLNATGFAAQPALVTSGFVAPQANFVTLSQPLVATQTFAAPAQFLVNSNALVNNSGVNFSNSSSSVFSDPAVISALARLIDAERSQAASAAAAQSGARASAENEELRSQVRQLQKKIDCLKDCLNRP